VSAFAPIVLNTKTYTNSDITAGNARWLEKSGGYGTSYSPLNLRVAPPTAQSRNFRVTAKLVVPVVSAADSGLGPTGTFLRQIGYDVTVTSAAGASDAERLDAWTRFKDFVNSDEFKNAVKFNEPISG
jgi:hypothetical protein